MAEIGDWYNALPFFTKWWLTLSVVFPILGRFGIVNPYYFYLLYEPIANNFQIWRLVTAVFFYPINPNTGFHFLMNLFFLYNYSMRLETDTFQGRPADYSFLLMFVWMVGTVLGLFMEIVVLMDMLVICVLYVWCQLNPEVIVSFWFGTRFKAVLLPWAYVVITLVLGGRVVDMLLGIFIGHLYYFLKFQYPVNYNGPSLLETPAFLFNWFPSVQSVRGFGGSVGPQRPAAPPTGDGAPARRGGGVFGSHDWGQGNRLN